MVFSTIKLISAHSCIKVEKNALVTMIHVEIVKYEHDKKMCNIKNARILQSESNK